MKFLRKYGGLALIIIGVLLLTGLHLAHFTVVNALLLIPLGLILTGVVLHVWMMKRDSRY
ncbi:MAG: hypothetical protein IJV45_06935 [Prevotella sp.]|nr:hypothetical protein [Prevotella sp.]